MCTSLSLNLGYFVNAPLPKGTCIRVQVTRNGQSCIENQATVLMGFVEGSAYNEQKSLQANIFIPRNPAVPTDPINTADIKVAIYENI